MLEGKQAGDGRTESCVEGCEPPDHDSARGEDVLGRKGIVLTRSHRPVEGTHKAFKGSKHARVEVRTRVFMCSGSRG